MQPSGVIHKRAGDSGRRISQPCDGSGGTVAAWGANDYGQTNLPSGLSGVLAVAGGTWHSLALRRDGSVVAWGDNTRGQTNVPTGLSSMRLPLPQEGTIVWRLRPTGPWLRGGENEGADATYAGQSVVPDGLNGVKGIAAGDYHSLAFKSDGSVVAWGDNARGQCSVPAGLSNVVALAAGAAHTLCLISNGAVVAWGDDSTGQCDLGAGLSGVVGLGAGAATSRLKCHSSRPLSPRHQGAGFSAVLQTLNRKHYALDHANSLSPNSWTSLTTNSGNGALELLADPDANTPQRFYRMRQW